MQTDDFIRNWNDSSDFITVKTSGSTGEPKTIEVRKEKMVNSANMTCDFLDIHEGDTALLCLSTDYIAGKMMVVRSIVRHLNMISVEPDGHPLKSFVKGGVNYGKKIDFAAMVPLQVYNSLRNEEEKEILMSINVLIIGGGAIERKMTEDLQSMPNRIYSTYAMTETLSNIAMRKINGEDWSEWYRPFHGIHLSTNEEQQLIIDAPQICDTVLTTNDIAEIKKDESGNTIFRILGRKDNIICSGGIKIQAETMEELLRPHIDRKFIVTYHDDEKLGQAVVLMIEGEKYNINLKNIFSSILPKYWEPKHIIFVERIPMTANGKPARAEAVALAKKILG